MKTFSTISHKLLMLLAILVSVVAPSLPIAMNSCRTSLVKNNIFFSLQELTNAEYVVEMVPLAWAVMASLSLERYCNVN